MCCYVAEQEDVSLARTDTVSVCVIPNSPDNGVSIELTRARVDHVVTAVFAWTPAMVLSSAFVRLATVVPSARLDSRPAAPRDLASTLACVDRRLGGPGCRTASARKGSTDCAASTSTPAPVIRASTAVSAP